ncbi:hypothetical protein [Actinoplanes awajinensis]|uniref:Uncharacterized protein n=1 Tax=Actinoplanes awajinensis subsp. mycoplanecinus TaxID=135947 RepID=A0A101JJQ0_9ACTN|nr:hypothetical protein [Actinoplanes awajinensis]KUL28008.1 hypothetical protein ADL15_32900 [Actinoplanes awajinensis subsp. mycoplanecinus]
MTRDAARDLLRRSLSFLLDLFGSLPPHAGDSLVVTVPAAEPAPAGRTPLLTEQFIAAVGASRAPPAPLA